MNLTELMNATDDDVARAFIAWGRTVNEWRTNNTGINYTCCLVNVNALNPIGDIPTNLFTLRGSEAVVNILENLRDTEAYQRTRRRNGGNGIFPAAFKALRDFWAFFSGGGQISNEDVNGANADWEAVQNRIRNRDRRGGSQMGNVQDTDNQGVFSMRNLIVFGAPGTGKSNFIEKRRKYRKTDVSPVEAEEKQDDELFFKSYERVTFYPTYSYSQFVGAYKPVMDVVDKNVQDTDDSSAKKVITYKFVPGPFLRVLTKALKDPENNYLLVVEEINRANAAAVFGDVFQLLDRRSDDGVLDNEEIIETGWSEYSISPSEEIRNYLIENKLENYMDELRIPKNLYIWATMNSADQGVFPLDTAFKRRWEFEYRSLDDDTDNTEQDETRVEFGNCSCNWGVIRKAINHLLARNRVNEDKLLSAFFVKGIEGVILSKRFQSKVLMYLWEDAARMCRRNVFSGEIHTLSDLFKKWDAVRFNENGNGQNANILSGVFQFDDSNEERVQIARIDIGEEAQEPDHAAVDPAADVSQENSEEGNAQV